MLARSCSKSSKLGFNSNVNQEVPDIQAGLRKGRETSDQIATSTGSQKKHENSKKNI